MVLEHKHLIVRAEVRQPPSDEQWACTWVRSLIDKIGMRALVGPFAKYLDVEGNRGLTVACIIETSHIAMHVWDEPNPALVQLDVYTCGALDINIIFRELEQFEPVRIEYKYLDREHGLVEIVGN
jgi:S-adenosylmethionine/arginine decarboxylase-like enzyme